MTWEVDGGLGMMDDRREKMGCGVDEIFDCHPAVSHALNVEAPASQCSRSEASRGLRATRSSGRLSGPARFRGEGGLAGHLPGYSPVIALVVEASHVP